MIVRKVRKTGIGCAAGVPVVAYGADHAYTGAKAMVTGKPQYTMGGQLLSQMTGLTPELANLSYDLPNLYAGAKPLLGATAKVGNQVVAEGAKIASETGHVARELSKDVKEGIAVVKNASDKAYLQAQYGYVDLIDIGVNGARNYVRNSIKSMGEQPVGTVLKGAATSASVKAGFEAYDYATGKALTVENLKNSGVNVAYSGALAAATAGMPIIPSIGMSIISDRNKDNGVYDVNKVVGGSVVGAIIEEKFGGKLLSPVLREIGVNSFEKIYEKLNSGDSNE
ncbi:hypothetical protein BKK54_11250 [Rodentibacter genomosp. 1]|uniref:Uncharacterized protein n=1 Tax=Rodentibacter genomosp. 1 TaxID=1908264 RepID=A0A1V3J0P3_9PAST|nr:hypothetical protein [Rodentibacter genomosp. 1]OOF47997.1 hypothetical protein BKK54_11250 [Rodentibacter genomosp. 1]